MRGIKLKKKIVANIPALRLKELHNVVDNKPESVHTSVPGLRVSIEDWKTTPGVKRIY